MSTEATETGVEKVSKTPKVVRVSVTALCVLVFLALMLLQYGLLVAIDKHCTLAGKTWSLLYWLMNATVYLPAAVVVVNLLFLTADARKRFRSALAGLLIGCLLIYGFSIYAEIRTQTWLGFKSEPYGPAFCSMFRWISGPPQGVWG